MSVNGGRSLFGSGACRAAQGSGRPVSSYHDLELLNTAILFRASFRHFPTDKLCHEIPADDETTNQLPLLC